MTLILRKYGEDLFSIPATTLEEALSSPLCRMYLYSPEVGFYFEHNNIRTNVNKQVEEGIKKGIKC